MAKEQKKGKLGLLKHLTLAPEAREDGGTSAPVEGRFRYFWSTFRENNGQLMLVNLLFLVTALPLIAILILPNVVSVERIYYWLNGVKDVPYYMSGVGFGLSSASDLTIARADLLTVYAWGFLFAGIAIAIASIGAAGLTHICVKFVWKDSFITKKDSYGNQVPRVVPEFFRGIKKFWWQFMIVGAILGVLVGGIGNAYVYFLRQFRLGVAGAGEWIMIIALSLVALFGIAFVMIMIPSIVLYDIPFVQKLKNSAIFTIAMALQNFFALIVIAIPVVLLAVTNGFINILILAVLLVFGGPFFGVMFANYGQYFAERIVTPLYVARSGKYKSKQKKKK
ncbi:MAG: hypothetical protein IJ735_02535 [Clostridia bacterium]|nr:hypothetical protein [Clostridia bacterium]